MTFQISGITQDIFGYRREVSVRGCPIVSLFTRLEEGCTGTSLTVAGLGLVEGVVCFCNGHLCNNSPSLSSPAMCIVFFTFAWILLLKNQNKILKFGNDRVLIVTKCVCLLKIYQITSCFVFLQWQGRNPNLLTLINASFNKMSFGSN